MVQLTRIYTRGGDRGKTSLGTGQRVRKYDLRVEAYGTVDEVNSTLGLARLHTTESPEIDRLLSLIQNDLFDLGADLCTPEQENSEHPPLRLSAYQVERLEKAIDEYNAALDPLDSFVLPGGSALSAIMHQIRTVCRRAERLVCALADQEVINKEGLCYLNRLSDLAFVLARYANNRGKDDILWVPGRNRK